MSVIAAAVTRLNVNRRLRMIGEAGGKEGRAYSQGKNLIVYAIFVVCSQTFTLFRLRKTAVPVKYRDTVSVCLCVPVLW